MNKITVNFATCEPAPSGGYNIRYRVAGSTDVYINAGNFFISPAIFYDTLNPAGTQYEGIIQSVSGDLDCNNIPWETGSEESPGIPDRVTIINGAGGFVITSVTNIAGFALDAPLNTGEQDTGTHTQDGSTGICVNLTFSESVEAHLELYVNDVLIQCIPHIDITGANCFNGTAIVPEDEIRIELIVGATC